MNLERTRRQAFGDQIAQFRHPFAGAVLQHFAPTFSEYRVRRLPDALYGEQFRRGQAASENER